MRAHIDRAAWKRIKARVAEPRSVTVHKGVATGPSFGVLEQLADLYDVGPQRPGETTEHFRQRCASRWNSLTIDTTAEESPAGRFSAEAVFRGEDQVSRVVGASDARSVRGPAGLRELSDANERELAALEKRKACH